MDWNPARRDNGRVSEERATIFGGRTAGAQPTSEHGGHLVAEALRGQGADTLFTLCGGHVLPILDGCLRSGIRVIDARHEQAAALMAQGWALATRRTGVCAITAGPGFTNAVTGIADANASGVPVVVLGGRTPLKSWKRDAIQDVDQLAIARPITKRATVCLAPERLGEYVDDAFWHARAGRPGCAYVELPTDVLMAAPGLPAWQPGHPAHVDPPAPASDAVDACLRLLEQAERPVAVLGSGAFWANADEAVRRFAEATGIPVTTTSAARGLLPDDDPGCLGGLVHGGVAVVSADVVLLVGSRFDGNMLFGGPPLFGPWQKIVQVDVRGEAFGGNRAPDLVVQADAAATLDALAQAWTSGRREAWLAQARQMADASRESWRAQCEAPAEGVHPGFVAREVAATAREVAGGNCTLVADGGDILTWGIAAFQAEMPGRLMTTGTALGTLGVGIPFAVAAKAARPAEPVFCLVGDGTFGFSGMELDTAARHGLPVVVVVSNNGAWVDVQYEQRQWFGDDRLVASTLGFRDYSTFAGMVGGFGARVDEPAQLRPALRKAVEAGVPAVVDVRTDPNVLSEILKGIGQLGVM